MEIAREGCGPETYEALSWPVEDAGEGPVLRTGEVVDVLEVPYAAGLLATHWWCRIGCRPDQVREIPALPDPERSLLAAADAVSFWFVVAAGLCPWPCGDGQVARLHAVGSELPVVRWHGPGGRLALPPALGAVWLYPPQSDCDPPNPLDLIELLTSAVGALDPGLAALRLNGARVVPASVAAQPGRLRLPVYVPSYRVRPGFYL